MKKRKILKDGNRKEYISMDGMKIINMDYQQTIEYLYNQLPMYQRIGKAAYKADLATTLELDKYLVHPHKSFKSIHIAGTNGKGSVSHILAAILQEAGYKTGLYTSPHLKDFRERIRINGLPVPKQYVVDFVNRHHLVFHELSPSFFEMTVAMAFDYFAGEKIDIAVVETGMGGRLDSTNIITPIVSVITNVGTDHTEFLGESLSLIAKEKAGIIKPGVPVVIGELQEETKKVFMEKAKRIQAGGISFASEVYHCDYALQNQQGEQSLYISKDGKLAFDKLETDLMGFYQQKNTITALHTVDILNQSGLRINKGNIYGGLKQAGKKTGLLGRWHKIGSDPLIVCDTAHNPEGIRLVLNQVHTIPHKNLHMVIGFVNDKKTDQILNLFPVNARYYFTQAQIPRALKASELQKRACLAGLQGNSYPGVKEAIDAAKNHAGQKDMIFVGGSTFVVAEALDNH